MSEYNLAPTSQVLLSLNSHTATFIREENKYSDNNIYQPMYVFEVKLSPEEYEEAIELKTGGKRRKRKTRKYNNRRRKTKKY